mgnify:CR=1 FL=1
MNNKNNIIVDYKNKTKNICKNMSLSPIDVDQLVIFLNYCFLTKNNFFVENFNKNMLKNVYHVYNTIKTNIISCGDNLYTNINVSELKLLKFILNNFVNKYKNLDEYVKEYINVTNIRNVLDNLHEYIQKIVQ